MNLFENLNPAQKTAVEHIDGPLLILAGAGSGKTKVLTTRIAYMLEKGANPEEILAITFTNKAAKEMKQRVEKLVGPEKGRKLFVSTFHSMGNRILRKHINKLGYDNNFAIYDRDDSLKLLKKVIKDLDLDPKKNTPRGMISAISDLKNQFKTPEQALDEATEYHAEIVAKIYQIYAKQLKSANALDFDDLLVMMLRLLKENDDVREYYANKFKYISVDEYQDTNYVQYLLVHLLAAKHRNLAVVGDPDQSIYGWRGADMQNILDFEKDYPDAKVITLDQNYRSTGCILRAANGVICNNMERKDKNLWTDKGEGVRLKVYEGQDESHEAWFIANEIEKSMHDEDRSYSDFAALYRTNAQSRALEKAMIRQNIPYRIYGGTSFYSRKEVKDVLAYLQVLNNPQDFVNLGRIINVPKRGIGVATVDKILAYATANDVSALDAVDLLDTVGSGPRNKLKAFYKMMMQFQEQVDKVPLTTLAEAILKDTGYIETLKQEGTTEAVNRIENLQEFLSETLEFDKYAEDKHLEEFLAATSLYTDLDTSDASGAKVTLMTLHAAKGLEFPVVFLAGLEEGIFPHQRALYEESEMEEERRLCYVGITRGMEKVFITRAWQRNMYGMTKYNQPSRFIEEIPEDCIKMSFERKKEQKKLKNLEQETASIGEISDFLLGDRVIHAKFGEGTVVKTEGAGAQMELSIAFPGQGIKIFIAEYAPVRRAD
jgi:DNA helicase-2/ATP-dependent DNA helicase PcrA